MIGREGFLLLNGINSKMKYIGIDPAFRKDGKGVCVIEGYNVSFIKLASTVDFVKFLFSLEPDSDIVFGIENSNLQKPLFDKEGNIGTVSAKGMRVGKNKAISQLIADLIVGLGFQCVEYSPKQKGSVISLNEFKLRLKANNQLFDIPATGCSKDKRAAYMIAMLAKNNHRLTKMIAT